MKVVRYRRYSSRQMFLLKQLAPGLLVASLVTAVLLGVAGWLWRRNPWAGAVALGLGYAVGHVTAAGWPALPPTEATQWLFFFALVALLAGVLDTFLRIARPWRLGLWLALCAGLLALLLRPKIQSSWTPAQSALWLLGLAALMTILAASLGRIARPHADAVFTLFAAALVCGGSGIALVLSGSLLLGQLAFVLAAGVGVALVAAWFFPELPLAAGAVPVIVALLTGLWVNGYFYAELPAICALLFALALVLPALLPSMATALGNSRLLAKPLLLRAAVVALPVAIAVFVAFRASPSLDY